MNHASVQLTVHLFGPPEIQSAGGHFILHSVKARALLFYLAATGRPHTRDHLASLLWSETTDSNARHSLRSSLYHLRQAFQALKAQEILCVEGDSISLKNQAYACDVLHFRQLLAGDCESTLVRALSLYKGPLLQGFTLADTPLFEEWRRYEAALLNQSYLNVLHRLAASAETRKAWDEAIEYVQRMVQMDRLSEETQRRLIELYVHKGAIGLALRQYRQLEIELSQELGIAPSAEMQALLNEILTTQRDTDTVSKAPPRASVPQISPFVGREDLRKQLLEISQKATAENGVTVLLQGEDGSGKSRLMNECIAMLVNASPSWIILQGSCSPFDDLHSYGPFMEAFQNVPFGGDLSDLLVEPSAGSSDVQGRFLWRLLQALRMLSRHAPLLLAIDDLQWANSSTLHLFSFLATRIRNLPIMLIGTVQNASSIPALQRLVMLGRRRGNVSVMSLPPLSLEAVSNLLHGSGIRSSSVAMLAQWLHERAGGSPFILLEILAQLRIDGILTQTGGSWSLDTGHWLRWRAVCTLPETTHDLLSWRLARLSAQARTLLEALAVAELPLPFGLLHELPDIQADQLLTTLDDLINRGLVIEAEKDCFTLSHHLLRETLLHQLSHLRCRMFHRQLVQMIENCPVLASHFPLRQIARHAVAGEDAERARRYGLRFLDELSQEEASTETVNFLHHLYDLAATTASPAEMLRLTHALGTFHQALGQLEEAAYWHRQHLERAQSSADLPAQVTAYFETGELALVTNDYHKAIAAARAGLALCEPVAEAMHMIVVARGYRLLGAALAMEGSNLLAAESHLQQAIAVYKRQGIDYVTAEDDMRTDDQTQRCYPPHAGREEYVGTHQDDLCATLFELGNVAAQRGELVRALALYQDAVTTAAHAHIYYFLALAHNNFAYHSLLLGRPEAAQHAIVQANRVAETHDLLGIFLHSLSTQGEIHLYLGDWVAATEVFQQGLTLAEELGNLERQAGYRAGLALAARGQHDLEKATALLEEALTLIADQGYWHMRTRIQLWLSETLLQCGRLDAARQYLDAACQTAQEHGRFLQWLQSKRLYACLLALQGDWHAANLLFTEILQRASQVDLPLEIARTYAAWGEAALRHAPAMRDGHALLAKAHDAFSLHEAKAELQAITVLLHG